MSEIVIRRALIDAWNAALDIGHDKDFRYEDGSLNEAAYWRARERTLLVLTRRVWEDLNPEP